jgi:hypothetical protein
MLNADANIESIIIILYDDMAKKWKTNKQENNGGGMNLNNST